MPKSRSRLVSCGIDVDNWRMKTERRSMLPKREAANITFPLPTVPLMEEHSHEQCCSNAASCWYMVVFVWWQFANDQSQAIKICGIQEDVWVILVIFGLMIAGINLSICSFMINKCIKLAMLWHGRFYPRPALLAASFPPEMLFVS
jgi:hypothetical protein